MARRRRRNWRYYYCRAKQAVRFTWKHRYAAGSLILSAAVAIAFDRWMKVDTQTQGIVALAVLALCLAVWVYWNIGYGGIYVVRSLHPITGRLRCGYVGLTERPPWIDSDGVEQSMRIDEHIFGSNRYRNPCPPKVWADTVVDWYFVHESWYLLPGITKLLELVNIKLRRPLYNDKMNRKNPNRIDCSPRNPNSTAHRQRAQRDQGIYTQAYLDAMQVHTPFLLRR